MIDPGWVIVGMLVAFWWVLLDIRQELKKNDRSH